MALLKTSMLSSTATLAVVVAIFAVAGHMTSANTEALNDNFSSLRGRNRDAITGNTISSLSNTINAKYQQQKQPTANSRILSNGDLPAYIYTIDLSGAVSSAETPSLQGTGPDAAAAALQNNITADNRPKTFADYESFCPSKGGGLKLCTLRQLCPGDADGSAKSGGGSFFVGDHWIPFKSQPTDSNTWVQLGTGGAGLCSTHQNAAGRPPPWGTNQRVYPFMQYTICCSDTDIDGNGSPSNRGNESSSGGGGSNIVVRQHCTTQCCQETKKIMTETDEEYSTADVVVSKANGRIIDDFSTNTENNFRYKAACEFNSGAYVELSYKAKCSPNTTQVDSSPVSITVIGQPRCYAGPTVCNLEAEGRALFEEFTLLPTEERADLESNLDWTCTGGIMAEAPKSGCKAAIEDLYNRDDITQAKTNIQPLTKRKKKFLLFNAKETLTLFPINQTTQLQNLCLENDGQFQQVSIDNVVCGSTTYDVVGYPICVDTGSMLCNKNNVGNGTGGYNNAVLEQLVTSMTTHHLGGYFNDQGISCTVAGISGVLGKTVSVGWAIGASALAAAWHLLF